MINGRVHEVTQAQEVRLYLSEGRAERLTREVRRHDRAWRPEPSLYEGVEGQILANEQVARQAEARLRTLERPSPIGTPAPDAMHLGGSVIGWREGRASETTRTVHPDTFRTLLGEISPGAREVSSPREYQGSWYQQPGGAIFGLRYSNRYRPTIDVVRSDNPFIRSGFKVHVK